MRGTYLLCPPEVCFAATRGPMTRSPLPGYESGKRVAIFHERPHDVFVFRMIREIVCREKSLFSLLKPGSAQNEPAVRGTCEALTEKNKRPESFPRRQGISLRTFSPFQTPRPVAKSRREREKCQVSQPSSEEWRRVPDRK